MNRPWFLSGLPRNAGPFAIKQTFGPCWPCLLKRVSSTGPLFPRGWIDECPYMTIGRCRPDSFSLARPPKKFAKTGTDASKQGWTASFAEPVPLDQQQTERAGAPIRSSPPGAARSAA
jgi:hypothetical protein